MVIFLVTDMPREALVAVIVICAERAVLAVFALNALNEKFNAAALFILLPLSVEGVTLAQAGTPVMLHAASKVKSTISFVVELIVEAIGRGSKAIIHGALTHLTGAPILRSTLPAGVIPVASNDGEGEARPVLTKFEL